MDKVRSIGKVTKWDETSRTPMGKWRLKLEDGRHSHVLRYILLQGAAIVEGQRLVWQANGRKRQKGRHGFFSGSILVLFPFQWQVMILSSLVWRNCWMFQQGVGFGSSLSFLKKKLWLGRRVWGWAREAGIVGGRLPLFIWIAALWFHDIPMAQYRSIQGQGRQIWPEKSISLELQVEPWRCGGRGRCTGNRPHPWRHRAGAHRREAWQPADEANIKGFSWNQGEHT